MSEPSASTATARLIHYSGRVQGVGFRATVAGIARGFTVTGWVQNLPDGRVQLLAQGSEAEVQRFLKDVRERWDGYIDDEQTETRQPIAQLACFEIRH